GGVAGPGRVEVLADLAAQSRGLKYHIAAVADEQLQFLPGRVQRSFGQGEAVDGGPLQSHQVGSIGLIARILGLAELLGGERMDDADLEAGGAEDALHRLVIATRPLDGHEGVTQVVGGQRLTHLDDRRLPGVVVVSHLGRRDADMALEVAEHELGAGLGAIERDEAKMFRAHLWDAWMDDPARLLYKLRRTGAGTVAGAADGHRDDLQEKGLG